MAIELPKEKEEQLIGSIKRYFDEHLDTEIGDLKAKLTLAFVVKEIGPTIYNQAVVDAQTCMQNMVSEIEGTCYEPEFGFWTKV